MPIKTSSVVYLPQGSVSKIIADLNTNNNKMSKIDELTLRLLGHPQAGWINIGKENLSKIDFYTS